MVTLEVEERGRGAAGDIRRRGFVPAVVYGRQETAFSIAVDARQLERVWKEAGHTSVVKLSGGGLEKETLIKEVQLHPVSGRILHADFYALERGKSVEISVPLEFVGEAPAEKAGSIVVKALHELEIKAEPANLPHRLEVDLSRLAKVGDRILASEVPLPRGVLLLTSGEEIIASVTAAVEEKEAAPAQAPAEAAPGSAAGEEKGDESSSGS